MSHLKAGYVPSRSKQEPNIDKYIQRERKRDVEEIERKSGREIGQEKER